MALLKSANPTPGETSLVALLASLESSLHAETFVFSTLPASWTIPASLHFQMSFREAEGLTLIVTQTEATSHHLDFVFPCRMITLNIHSSLEAVGFIAFIAGRLTEKGIGVNPVSGFYHDHLFVPSGREDETMKLLRDISDEAQRDVGKPS